MIVCWERLQVSADVTRQDDNNECPFECTVCVCNNVSVLKSFNRCSSNSSSGEHPGRATETGSAVHVVQKIA